MHVSGGGLNRKVLALAIAACLCPVASRGESRLTEEDVRTILLQAASAAERLGLRAHIAVTDREGEILAAFAMSGAPAKSVILADRDDPVAGGLEGTAFPADLVAVTKAGTGAFLSTAGHAFSTRTASFIIERKFPPQLDFTPLGGPLFGVQFSSLPCSDVRNLPLGLSGDPGGIPLYKNGDVVGGLGVEGDGVYTAVRNPLEDPRFVDGREEVVAVTGAVGFEAPAEIRAERILVDGLRFPYVHAEAQPGPAIDVAGTFQQVPREGGDSCFRRTTRGGSLLTESEVARILGQALTQAGKTRAAIRRPLNQEARVTIAVVDTDGTILGSVQSEDAPRFGIDIASQKARTANFFSHENAGNELRREALSMFLDGGVPLDGSIAYSTRAVGFLAQPLYPPGIAGSDHGPLSIAEGLWSPFNTGLQTQLILGAIGEILGRSLSVRDYLNARPMGPCETLERVLGPCTPIGRLQNGITIFPGGVPLYKGGRLAGAIGVSGDGVDQDDLIAAAGSVGFEAPKEMRSDTLLFRGTRLPYVKFPRSPELP